MELAWLVDLSALLAYIKVLCKSCKKLLLSKSVEVLHNAVVVDDLEVALRECNSHEIVVLLLTSVVWILLAELCADACSSCCTVVTISYIECWNACEDLSDTVDIRLLIDYPEMVTEAVLCDEVVFRIFSGISSDNAVDLIIVRI